MESEFDDLFHLDLLTEDTVKEILFFLDSRSLVCVKRTCAKFLRLAREIFGERKIRGDIDVVREVSLRSTAITILDGLLAVVCNANNHVQLLSLHGERVRSLGVSAKVWSLTEWNEQLAVGLYGDIRLYSLEGACTATLSGHTGWVLALCVWGELLASGSYDDTIKLWDTSGTCVRTLTGHINSVGSLVVWGELLASGSWDKTIKLWDAAGTCVRTLTDHESWVTCLVVFAGFLVSGSNDKTLRWWDASGTCVKVLRGHPERICGLASSAELLASACCKATKLWNREGECVRTIKRDHNTYTSHPLLFWRDQLVECLSDRLLFWA